MCQASTQHGLNTYLLNELCKDEQGVPVTNRKDGKNPSVPNR